MAGVSLVANYTFFALIATAANILTQYVSLSFYSTGYGLYAAMAIGTLAGLIVKYILDRNFIFYYRVKNRNDDMTTFVLYSIMGMFTTVIFWAFEIGFDAFFKGSSAKYIGAVLGLTIGYATKYYLDKRFVFHRD